MLNSCKLLAMKAETADRDVFRSRYFPNSLVCMMVSVSTGRLVRESHGVECECHGWAKPGHGGNPSDNGLFGGPAGPHLRDDGGPHAIQDKPN